MLPSCGHAAAAALLLAVASTLLLLLQLLVHTGQLLFSRCNQSCHLTAAAAAAVVCIKRL
jgi:hypothetical protein